MNTSRNTNRCNIPQLRSSWIAFLATACLLLCGLLPVPAQQMQAPTHGPAIVVRTQAPPRPAHPPAKRHGTVKDFENFPVNIAAFRLVNSHRSPAGDVFFAYYYWLGSGIILLPVAVLVFIFRRQQLAAFLIAVTLNYIVIIVIKSIFAQPRPPIVLGVTHMHLLHIAGVATPYDFSFPSGDVAQAFATAIPLMVDTRWYTQLLLFLYAILIGYERMYVGVHFPLDVMTGALIGVLSGAVALAIVNKWRKATVLTPEEMKK